MFYTWAETSCRVVDGTVTNKEISFLKLNSMSILLNTNVF
jgi:hypothetical protein